MEAQLKKNPWLGLESYKEGEVIYGRDNDIRALAQCVLCNSSTLFYGKSGIGKSSILNAGILPAARRNEYLPVIIRLSHKADDATYLQQIKDAIKAAGVTATEFLSVKDPKQESFWEYFHRHTFVDKDDNRLKLLIIFDQFEEIFTLQDELQKKKHFFRNLTDLLNDVKPDDLQPKEEEQQSESELIEVGKDVDLESFWDDFQFEDIDLPQYVEDNDIHFVFTLREDFLSEFEYFAAAIPSLKHNRYGLRPLNEEQAAQVIMRPIPEMVDKKVAKLIIEKVTKRTDFELDGVPEIEVDSAVLSLYLNRLYDAKTGDKITAELVEEKDGEIIADFYNDALSEISPESIDYLEGKLLTDQGRRDNVAQADAINKGKVSKKELEILCDRKKILRRFNYAGELRLELVHDILCSVVQQNRQLRLEQAEKEAEKAKMAEQRKKLRNSRRKVRWAMLVVFSLLGVMGGYWYWYWYLAPISHKYGSVGKVWGRFVGIEPLSDEVAKYRDNYFVLHKKGYGAKAYSSMECRNKYGKLSTNHGLHPYIYIPYSDIDTVAELTTDRLIRSVCRWEFVSDPRNDTIIIQERMFDADKNFVYAFNYSPRTRPTIDKTDKNKNKSTSKDSIQGALFSDIMISSKSVIGTYVDAQGLPFEILKDGYRFVKITRDNRGRDMLVEYFDYDGSPSTNSDGAFQQYCEYDEYGQCTAMYSLNVFGRRMIDRAGNCGQIFTYDGYRCVELINVDEFGKEIAVYSDSINSGYVRVTSKYDNYGRGIESAYWRDTIPAEDENGCHKYVKEYDDANNAVTLKQFDTNGNIIKKYEIKFDTAGNELEYREYTDTVITISRQSKYEDGKLMSQTEITNVNDSISEFSYERKKRGRGYTETRRWKGEQYTNYTNVTDYDSKKRIIKDSNYELDGETPYENDHVWHKIVRKYIKSDVDSTHPDYCIGDSVIYYRVDGKAGSIVDKIWPNKLKEERIIYGEESDTIQNELYNIDEYECRLDSIDADGDVTQFTINEKTHKRTKDKFQYLTRYKSPRYATTIRRSGR